MLLFTSIYIDAAAGFGVEDDGGLRRKRELQHLTVPQRHRALTAGAGVHCDQSRACKHRLARIGAAMAPAASMNCDACSGVTDRDA